MDSKACVSLLVLLLGVALALAGPVAGGTEARIAGTGTQFSADAARQQLIAPPTTSKLGGEVHRRILGSSITVPGLNPDKPACIKGCPAAGGSYTGRGCKKAYGCTS